ncbi:hypothetical protein ACET3Z_004703 [Daucus carota]
MNDIAFTSLQEVSSGSYEWAVKVRVLRKWRGTSNTGKEFKGFNLLLIDSQNCRLPGFVPALVAQKYERKIVVGNIYALSNFTVKDYKPDDKFRCVCCEKQIYFSNFTEVEPIAEDGVMIAHDMFDFSDLGDLIDIADDNTYLTDVIGVIQKDFPLRKFVNKNGVSQGQLKFEITDGRCCQTVTFWDGLAEEFELALKTVSVHPAIVIVASAKITSWQKKVDIANVTATMFYLNYDHHSVSELRQMLGSPLFSRCDFSSQIPETFEEHGVESVKTLGVEYLNMEVVCQLKIILIVNMDWYRAECSSCYREISIVDGEYKCIVCSRDVPFAEKKFQVMVEALDDKEHIELSLNDRTIRKLIGKTVVELLEEGESQANVPSILRGLESKWFSAKLKISSLNIEVPGSFFYVSDMFELGGSSQHLVSTPSVAAEEGDRCHAWIASTALDNLKDHFSEGLVYQIENFFVLPYKNKHMYRPFRNKFHICFTYFTHAFAMDTNNHIPRHVFDPISLTHIRRHLDQTVYLIDVAGVPENVTPISHFVDKENQAKCLVRFRVKNRRYHVKVTFWDEFALEFVKETQKTTQIPPVIMISSCRVRTYRGNSHEQYDVYA